MAEKKEKWYPGKYLKDIKEKRAVKRQTVSSTRDSDEGVPNSNWASGQTSFNRVENQLESMNKLDLVEQDVIFSSGHNVDGVKGKGDKPQLGMVTLKISEAKFLAEELTKKSENSLISINVEYGSKVFLHDFKIKGSNCGELVKLNFKESFPISSIETDIVIKLHNADDIDADGQQKFNTLNIIPVSTCLTTGGKPKEVQNWYLLGTSYYRKIHNIFSLDAIRRKRNSKYYSNYGNLDGYGLKRTKEPLGFIKVSVNFSYNTAFENANSKLPIVLLPFVFSTGPVRKGDSFTNAMVCYEESNIPFEDYAELLSAIYSRDMHRIERIFTAPKLLLPFLSFPQSLVLLTFYGCLCYWVTPTMLPFIVCLTVLLNGSLISASRDPSKYIVIHNQYDYESSNSNYGHPKKVASTADLDEVFIDRVKWTSRLHSFVSNLEILVNIWSFADLRFSLVAYTALCALSVIASLSIFLLGFHRFLFICGCILFLYHSGESLLSQANDFADNAGSSVDIVKPIRMMVNFRKCVLRFWASVPDELELQHRFIANKYIVKEGGGEFYDAAKNFNSQKD